MDATTIICPYCHQQFALNAAIERTMLEKLQVKLDADAARRNAELATREAKLTRQEESLREMHRSIQQEVERKLAAERAHLIAEQQGKAKEQVSLEMTDLQNRLAEKSRKLTEAQQSQLELLKQQREFEEQKQAFDLELARHAQSVRDAVRKEKDEEFRLKEAESQKKEADLRVQLDDMKRKLEQGSQQTQGEVLELDLESHLHSCFGGDAIVPVAKGVHGGDILQNVRSALGQDCGTILWETKRTKTWSDGWLPKLRDDARAAKAQLAVLVSTALPKDLANFECREGVWISSPVLAVPLAAALRHALIETAAARRAIEGRHDKMEVVYDYLSGNEFKLRVAAIVEAFTTMREDLESEKRWIQKNWAKREKLIDRVLANTATMWGDLSGIIGKSLPTIEQLEQIALPDALPDPDGALS